MKTFNRAASCLTIVLALGVRAWGGDAKSAANAMLDGKAIAIVRSAIDFLNSTTTYSMSLTNHELITAVTDPTKKKETTATYEVSVERPNKLAMVIKNGALRCAVLSDGKTLCAYAPAFKVYTQQTAPKTLAELFDIDEMKYIVKADLSSALFIDNFAMNDALDIIMDGVKSLKIAGVETVGDAQAYHLHFEDQRFDWDMWIQVGTQPLLRKISMEGEQMSKDETGPVRIKKTIVTQFDDWKVNGAIPQDRFVFTPPTEAKRVPTFIAKPGDEDKPYDPKLLGEPAPPIVAKMLVAGTFDLAEHKNKDVVVLDFWATWCGPCRKAMPIVSAVCKEYEGKGVVGYAVNLKETPEKVKEFQAATPSLTMPIVLDQDGKFAEAYRVQPIPMTVIVGKSGVVEAVYLGLPNDLEGFKTSLHTQLDALIAGKSLLTKEAPKTPGNEPKDIDKKKSNAEPEAK